MSEQVECKCCIFFSRCTTFGVCKPDSKTCDWTPSQFEYNWKQRAEKAEAENKMLVSEHYIITAIDMECQTREEKEYVGAFMTNAVKKIAELESELAQLKEANRWISVEERLPKEGEWALAVYTGGVVAMLQYITSIKQWSKEKFFYWRPLPEPPEAE